MDAHLTLLQLMQNDAFNPFMFVRNAWLQNAFNVSACIYSKCTIFRRRDARGGRTRSTPAGRVWLRLSISLSSSRINMQRERERERDGNLTDVQTHTHTHTLTDTARHAWCKGEEILSPCGAPIRTPSPASFPLLRTRSICSALINQGSGGQGVATWNKAWSSHGVRWTTSWHSAKLFLSCGLTRPPSRLHRLLVFFPLAPCVTRPARRHLSGDVTLWPGGKDEGC